MNKSISKLRHIQESNLILEQRIIMEQSDVWNSIKPIGNNPNGPKEIITDFAASTKLTIEGHETTLIDSRGNKYIPYVGARIQSRYNEKITSSVMSKMPSVSALNGRFGCVIEVYVTTQQNVIMKSTGVGSQAEASNYVTLFTIKIHQTKEGKFQLTPWNNIANNPGWLISPSVFSLTKGGRYKSNIVAGQISNNLSSSLGDLYTKINTELERLGFPIMPDKINIVNAVTL